MAKSILQSNRCCYICKCWYNVYTSRELEEHHIFPGTSRRALAEELGLKVFLCVRHHLLVHSAQGAWALRQLKADAQAKYDGLHGVGALAVIMDKNYGGYDEI